jgi:ribosomal protein S18 acetylase RimI-like enzyme
VPTIGMIAVSPEWAIAGYALRPAGADDRAFQRTLFGFCRPDAIFLAPWPRAQRDAFLDSQFALQDAHYHRYYADAAFLIVTIHDVPAGRLIVDQGPRKWQVVDIGLMPDHRGCGFGTALLRAVQTACRAAGAQTLGLNVERDNRARGLYARLGFTETGDGGTRVEMTWKTAAQLKTAS